MMTNAQVPTGITVRPHEGSVGCTEVLSSRPFWHYNPRFQRSMEEIMGKIKRAETMPDGGFHVVVAGEWATAAELPLCIVSAETKAALDNAYADHMQAEGEMHKAERAFEAALRPTMAVQ